MILPKQNSSSRRLGEIETPPNYFFGFWWIQNSRLYASDASEGLPNPTELFRFHPTNSEDIDFINTTDPNYVWTEIASSYTSGTVITPGILATQYGYFVSEQPHRNLPIDIVDIEEFQYFEARNRGDLPSHRAIKYAISKQNDNRNSANDAGACHDWDKLTPDRRTQNESVPYATDLALWLRGQITLLSENRTSEIDVENLISELNELEENESISLQSSFDTLLRGLHLLNDKKTKYKTRKNCKDEIVAARFAISASLERSPSLVRIVPGLINERWRIYRERWPRDPSISPEEYLISEIFADPVSRKCPYKPEQVLGSDFFGLGSDLS